MWAAIPVVAGAAVSLEEALVPAMVLSIVVESVCLVLASEAGPGAGLGLLPRVLFGLLLVDIGGYFLGLPLAFPVSVVIPEPLVLFVVVALPVLVFLKAQFFRRFLWRKGIPGASAEDLPMGKALVVAGGSQILGLAVGLVLTMQFGASFLPEQPRRGLFPDLVKQVAPGTGR